MQELEIKKQPKLVTDNVMGKRYLVAYTWDKEKKYWNIDYQLSLSKEEAVASIENRTNIQYYAVYEIELPVNNIAEDIGLSG